MARVYKQFTAQDVALIPFNAHKQYDFNSASAASNSTFYYSARWTSESIDIYSSGSASADINTNTIKYNQIDKLYYRNYLTQLHDKLGPIEYIKQPRNLYEKVNIISIPMGLYGNEIKPGSFYLSSSNYHIIDDKFGNLLLSGSGDKYDTGSYPTNIQENVFRLDPVKGFKKYDLGVHSDYVIVNLLDTSTTPNDYSKNYYRRGTRIANNIPTTYSSNNKTPVNFYAKDHDNSYFNNNIHYHNVTFNTSSLGTQSHKFPKIIFNSTTGSFISASHNERLNFQDDEDFSISFWIKQKGISTQDSGITFSSIGSSFIVGNYGVEEIVDNKKRYIISKSKKKTINAIWNISSSQDPQEVRSEPQYPYEIYMQSQSLYFAMSDGEETKTISVEITSSNGNLPIIPSHILCQNSGSEIQLYLNGTKIASSSVNFKEQIKNEANLYIGSSGKHHNYDNNGGISTSIIGDSFVVGNYESGSTEAHKHFNGDLNNINIWSRAYNSTIIANISSSINASPYIGNLFYKNGFGTITHPSYHNILNSIGVGELVVGGNTSSVAFEIGNEESKGINKLQFQGTHLIYEHEYQCTVQEYEFNSTTNLSARKLKSPTNYELANFTTSSLFKPHVTTIGLYDKNNELLVVGKLAQPIKMSSETDTTFIMRWDT